MISNKIKQKIFDIVSVFETGKPQADYGALVVLPDGPGKSMQITYGKHQATENASLPGLIREYVAARGKYAADFRPFIPKLGKQPLWGNRQFKDLLQAAADDQTMQEVQDAYFDEKYWAPAFRFFTANGFTSPLSMLVIYDSYIHSGGVLDKLRARFAEPVPARGGDEKKWTADYVNVRDRFLELNASKLLRNSDYRTDTLLDCIAAGNWDLAGIVSCKFNSPRKGMWVSIP